MPTTHTSTSYRHIHTQLPHAWTKHYPQYKDIKINGEDKEALKGGRGGEEGWWG